MEATPVEPVDTPAAVESEAAAATPVLDARSAYIAQLRKEAAAFPAIPDVEVAFDFSYDLLLPASQVDFEVPSVVHKFMDLLLTPVSMVQSVARLAQGKKDESMRAVSILRDCKGVLRPGTISLLMAPPGHGKTCFLKALAGHLPAQKLSGSIKYSGLSATELKKQGLQLKLLANYVDQLDVHLPFLTVRETAAFACVNSTVEPSLLGDPMLVQAANERVDRVIKLLSLTGCADTLVGNNLVRGVSGGEKKRVTIAEALVSNARLLCMDEISTGLDASVTFDICASIRAWAKETRGTVVIALLQPTPEVYSLFDDIIMLREGTLVYHGARTALPGYLSGLGFTPPDGATDGSADVADWLVELLASPAKLLKKAAAARLNESTGDLQELGGGAPRTTAELLSAWDASPASAAQANAAAPAAPMALTSDYARRQYARPYPRSPLAHFQSLLKRQFQVTMRNGLFVGARIMSSVVISVILGSVWFNLDKSQALAKFGMLLFCVLQVAFANFSETPFAVEYKYIALKQIASGMYPPWAYSLSGTIVQLPTAAIESAAFSIILYFMVNLVRDGGRWAFFYLVIWLVNVGIGSLFRMIAYVVPSYEAAQTAPGPFIAIQVIFAGFLIPPNHMGTVVNGTPWLIFLYYSSVFAYALRSLAQNEFYSPPYNVFLSTNTTAIARLGSPGTVIRPIGPIVVTQNYYPADICARNPDLQCGAESYGTQVLHSLAINLDPGWKWGGIAFLFGFVVLANLAAAAALGGTAAERNIGTARTKDEEEEAGRPSEALTGKLEVGEGGKVAVTVSPPGSVASVLPFTPMTVAWHNLKYTVQLNKNLGGGSKVLLQGISGVARPGRLLSLMGASGAGKSTLLDVIAGRKTAGAKEGDILLNGFPTEAKSFARLTAYCEQQDIHNSFATVTEALHFSAALRLPSSVDVATREAYVEEVIDLLELRSIASRLVGEVGAANGLAPGQRKLLTMGVELCANAPILFLDEPTSGLDARAASLVIREVRKVAHTGRTVITTIHQPSSEVFFRFDDMLLMQRGGWLAYFGPLGPKARDLVAYVEAIPGVHRCPRGMNPASWVLDVLAGTDSSAGASKRGSLDGKPAAGEDAASTRTSLDGRPAGPAAGTQALDGAMVQERLFASPTWATAMQDIEVALKPAEGASKVTFSSIHAQPFPVQLRRVLERAMRSYNRNPGYMYTKTMVLLGLLILFGTIYYKIQQATDCAPATGTDKVVCKPDAGGVQSIVSVVFLTTLFIGILCMNTMLPVLVRERAVFYRERASALYAPEAHSMSYAIAEIPWLIFLLFLIIPCFYFMAGFSSKAEDFFFYVLTVFMLSYTMISLGQWAAAHFATAEVAQAIIGLVIPLAFLFGGLYLPKPQIPNGAQNGHPHIYWLWAYYLDPISYSLEALVPARFYDQSRPSNSNHTVMTLGGPVNSYEYVTNLYAVNYQHRWVDIACLVAFVGGLQFCHMRATRVKVHMDR